jgi:hypothetical protein
MMPGGVTMPGTGAMMLGAPGSEMYGGFFGGFSASQDIVTLSIVALGKIGPKAKAALPVLQRLVELRDSALPGENRIDPSYSALASEAIAKIQEQRDGPQE